MADFRVGDTVRYRPGSMTGFQPSPDTIGTVLGVGSYIHVRWVCRSKFEYHYFSHEVEIVENGLETMLRVAFGD